MSGNRLVLQSVLTISNYCQTEALELSMAHWLLIFATCLLKLWMSCRFSGLFQKMILPLNSTLQHLAILYLSYGGHVQLMSRICAYMPFTCTVILGTLSYPWPLHLLMWRPSSSVAVRKESNNLAGGRKKWNSESLSPSGVPRNFVQGGVQQIQLRTERGSGGGSPPSQGFWRQL